ncbi:hypothetical protein NB491_07735 [Vibrio alginolyticus]|uniref:hypothetical protein n=1 Tax=Vibrio alginolyticus TaxID=663 RepID=UPI001E07364A|nr:hypothetical protein [Vibrio alginolyticus]EGR2699503.1 hypothetical protein [Vibrio parahaemolyticus]MCQ9070223.1 hypothetical protein [Vibrio alginolyticus]MCR9635868.1 hypothetical protein [Vibrio alginolyticus]
MIDNVNIKLDPGNEIWFQLIKQWKESGRGKYGLTFPFLVGALAKLKVEDPTKEFITEVFTQIINNPVKDYYGEVRWCANIDEPVISVNQLDHLRNVSIKDSFKVGDVTSLAFTTDLMSMLHLDCDNANQCLKKLIDITHKFTKEKRFSKNKSIFSDFSEDDLRFISDVSALKIK